MRVAKDGIRDMGLVLEALMRRNSEKWYRFVLGFLGQEADAEDVLQEAAQKVLGCERHFRSEDDVRMYLSRAISNLAIDLYHMKKRERRKLISIEEHALSFDAKAASPQVRMEEELKATERSRLKRLMMQGLRKLPAKQYQALCLTLLEPKRRSLRDAVEAHGIPYSTLRHRRNQGLRRLRKHLDRALRKPT